MNDQHRTRVWAIVTSLCTLGLVAVYLGRIDPLRTLTLRLCVPALCACPVLLAALGAGTLARGVLTPICRLLELGVPAQDEDPRPSLSWDLLTGLPMFGTVCFLLGLLSTASMPLIMLTLAFGLAGLLRVLRAPRPSSFGGSVEPYSFALLMIALCIAVSMAQLPPFTLDELAYHLATPKMWLLEGRVVELPLNSHTYFPSGIESSALPLLSVLADRGSIAFHFVILATACAAPRLVYEWIADESDSAVASVATACLATTPALVLIAGTGWIDWPLTGTAVALCHALRRALRGTDLRAADLACVALAVAAGASTKYTFAAVMVACFAASAWVCRNQLAKLVRLFATALLGLVIGATFFVRNVVWAHNPVAPFLDPSAPHVAKFNDGEGAVEIFLNYLFHPLMADESLGIAAFALVLAFVFSFASLRKDPWLRALGVMSLGMLLIVGAMGAAGRLLYPFATLVGVAGAIGLSRALPAQATLARQATSFVLLGASTLQLGFAFTAAAQHTPLEPSIHDEHRFLVEQHKATELIFWANQTLAFDSLTLVIGIHEPYWFSRRVRTAGNFDGPRMNAYLQAKTAEALFRKLRADGFTHVAVWESHIRVGGELHGRAAESTTVLDPITAKTLQTMLAQRAHVIGKYKELAILELAR